MKLGVCQIIWLGLMLLSLGFHLARNGEPRNDRYSFGTALISFVIQFVLVYFGGFFE